MTVLVTFAGDSVLLAHNASFDMNFLYAAYEKVLGKPMKNDYVDTLRVARKALPDMKHHGLADICKALGISNEQEHRAASDAIAAHECYKLMRPWCWKDLVMNRATSGRSAIVEISAERETLLRWQLTSMKITRFMA